MTEHQQVSVRVAEGRAPTIRVGVSLRDALTTGLDHTFNHGLPEIGTQVQHEHVLGTRTTCLVSDGVVDELQAAPGAPA